MIFIKKKNKNIRTYLTYHVVKSILFIRIRTEVIHRDKAASLFFPRFYFVSTPTHTQNQPPAFRENVRRLELLLMVWRELIRKRECEVEQTPPKKCRNIISFKFDNFDLLSLFLYVREGVTRVRRQFNKLKVKWGGNGESDVANWQWIKFFRL